MKIITFLVVVQLLLLLFLTQKIFVIEDRLESGTQKEAQAHSVGGVEIEESPLPMARNTNGLDENGLRQIIRSELRAYSSGLAGDLGKDAVPTQQFDTFENAARLEVVKQELSYYIEKGEISKADMAKLQHEIARLDPDSRTQMLGELVRALNSGDLEGQL